MDIINSPSAFCDPTTHELFKDPQLSRQDGRTYDRSTLPHPLDETLYVPNRILKTMIELFHLFQQGQIGFEQFRDEIDKRLSHNQPQTLFGSGVVTNKNLQAFLTEKNVFLASCQQYAERRQQYGIWLPPWAAGNLPPFP